MSPSPPLARRLLSVVIGASLVTLAGCSKGVEVSEGPLASNPACQSIAALWPQTVGLQPRVDTASGAKTVAAWGDPAILARCGVEPLGPTTAECITVDGVDWVARDFSDGVGFVTYGRTPALEVLIPKAYAPEPMLLPAFTKAAKSLPTNGHACV